MQGCVLRPLYRGDAQKQLRSRETTDERFRSSKPMEWAWLDLNQRPHPERRIARVSTGSAAPKESRAWRACPILILRGGPGHGGLIRYRGLSAVRTAVSPGRR